MHATPDRSEELCSPVCHCVRGMEFVASTCADGQVTGVDGLKSEFDIFMEDKWINGY